MIKRENGRTKATLGYGDISVGTRMKKLKNGQTKASVYFKNSSPLSIGQRTENINSDEEYKSSQLVLDFNNTSSIDVVINALERAKEQLQQVVPVPPKTKELSNVPNVHDIKNMSQSEVDRMNKDFGDFVNSPEFDEISKMIDKMFSRGESKNQDIPDEIKIAMEILEL